MTSTPARTPSSRRSHTRSGPQRRPTEAEQHNGDILIVGDAGPLASLTAAGYHARPIEADQLDAALATTRWDLVLVGCPQPADARAACQAVRAHPRASDVPVVAQLWVEHGHRPAALLEAGADDYVLAPCQPIELLTRVRLLLAARQAAGIESRWQAMVANLPGAVYRCELDAHWTMHHISDQVMDLTGYPAEDFIGNAQRTFASIIHPEDRDAVQADVAAAVQLGEPFVSSYRIVRADGALRHVVDRGRLVDGPHGQRWLDAFVVDVTAQQDAEQRLRDTLAGQAAAEERARLARDLHDSVSQSLFSMTLHARAAQLALQRDGRHDGPEHDSIAELRELTQTALAEMRALIFELRPEALTDEGLVAALRKHAAAIAAREAIPVAVAAPEHVALDADVEEALYRLVQEALHNVIQHAHATAVTVAVQPRAGGRVIVEVLDDGDGFDPDAEHPGHLGLLTMRERVSRIDGTIRIASRLGVGTCVRVEAPTHRPS